MTCRTSAVDRILLSSGGTAALIFCGISTHEMLTRPGFDIRRHAISMLSLGDHGWVMAATFVVAGLLTLLCAIGLRRVLFGGAWLPLLIGLYGLGLVLAGIFPAPASFGFPPGTPNDQPPVMTARAIVHTIAFVLAFTSLTMACFVAARRLGGGWATFCTLTGVMMPVLIALGMASWIPTGIAFYIATLMAWAWLAIVVMRLADISQDGPEPAGLAAQPVEGAL
jgi:hypothetical protein